MKNELISPTQHENIISIMKHNILNHGFGKIYLLSATPYKKMHRKEAPENIEKIENILSPKIF